MGVDSTNNGIDVAANYIDAGVWSLGCDITLEDMDAEIQEIRVNDIRLSGSVSVKEVSIDINPERSKMMDLDINVVVDGLNPSIVESQVVPYDNILNITSGSLEAIKEKGFAASAYSSKKIYDSIKNIEEKINNIGTGGGGGGGSLPPEQVEAIEKLLKWFSFDDERGLIKANYGLYSIGSITAGGRGASSSGDVATFLYALKDVSLSDLTDGQSLVYDASSGMWVNRTISGGGGSADVTYQSVVDALGYTPFDSDAFTKANIKNALGIKDWALASSKPSYTFAEITSKPTTLSGYGITDAVPTWDGVFHSSQMKAIDNYRQVGYGNSTNGWKTNGPAIAFGIPGYTLRIQAEMALTDNPAIYASLQHNSTAYGWVRLLTDANAYTKADVDAKFLQQAGGTITGDVIVNTKLTSTVIEALQYFADGKLIMHRNAGAAGAYINYGGRTEGLTLYGSALSFNIGDTGAALILSANKDASFIANLAVAGEIRAKNYMIGQYLPSAPLDSFATAIFGDANSSYCRLRIQQTATEMAGVAAQYCPLFAIKSYRVHGFISFGYNNGNKNKCYIGAGEDDKINWSGVLFHDNMHLIPKDDATFLLGQNGYRWSALHAVSVFTDNIYGNVPKGGTYQRYRLLSSGDRMYLQVGAQDGTATTGKLTISGINVATLLDLEIVAQSTIFTGAVQVNGASRFVSLATFDKGIKIGDATLSWDSAAGMLKTDKGLYSTGAITAGGKSSAGQSPSTSVASTEWYNIKTKRMTDKSTIATDIYNIIENFNERLLDDQYRIVLMTFKRKTRQGYGWRIPMFSPRYNADTGVIVHEDTPCAIDWNNTWWRVQSSETLILNQTGMNITDIINIEATGYRFQRSNSKKIRIGFAIFKKTLDAEGKNVGTWGWQRVSNIAEIMLYYAANRDITMIRVIE